MPKGLSSLLVASIVAGFATLAYPQQAHADESEEAPASESEEAPASEEIPGRVGTSKHQAARSTTVQINNNTECILTLQKSVLYRGVWTPGKDPSTAVSISKDGNARVGSESNGVMTGAQGLVRYVATDCDSTNSNSKQNLNGQRVTINWDNPYFGSNRYKLETDSGLKASLPSFDSNGKGNNATLSVRIDTAR